MLTTSGSHNTVWLNLGAGETIIDWGDGNVEEHDYNYTRSTTHAYADDGDYTITLIGDKTTKLHISGYSEAKKADITGVDIGTQYEQVILDYCDLTSLFVPKGVDVETGSSADVASVVYENGADEIGTYDYEHHFWVGEYPNFADCESLTSVTIPDSIKIIHENAFDNTPYKTANTSNYCFTAGKVAVKAVDADNKTVVIPNTVKYINPYFSWVTSQSSPYSLSGVTIGSAVEEIGDYAFYLQADISTLSIPASVTTIGTSAFKGARPRTLTIGMANIPNALFEGNTNLSTLTLQSGVTSIGADAFSDCKISSITFPATVTSIGANAFKWNKLTNITIPATVTSIGADAFANNSTLTEIHFAGSTPPAITAAIAPNTVYIFVPVGAVSAYEAAGYTNVHEEGWTPPQDISLTWVTGGINATTGVDKTDSNSERSNSTAAVASEVYSVVWRNPDWRLSYTQFMICCYNKSDGTYAGTYNGTTVTKSETHIHEFNSSDPIDYDLTSLNSQYDFRFVVTGQWGSQSGQGQDIKVYGLPI